VVKDFAVVWAQAPGNPTVHSQARQSGKQAAFDLTLLAGESYEIEGTLTCRYQIGRFRIGGESLKTNKVVVAPGEEGTELTLVIPAAGCREVKGQMLLTEHEPPQ
jgi:hypothetical protein